MDDDQLDLAIDIFHDRDRLWPIYRHVIRLYDFSAVPCRVMFLFMEARHRGIWTSQLCVEDDSVPLARVGQVLDGLKQLEQALQNVGQIFHGPDYDYRINPLNPSTDTSTDGEK